jgi:hypothetical protein
MQEVAQVTKTARQKMVKEHVQNDAMYTKKAIHE